MNLVAATFNSHKIAEIQALLGPLGCTIRALGDYTSEQPVEDGDTFEANAIIKARYGFELTGLPTIADDSGLEVDALNGAPGVWSARFAGPDATDSDNNRKLLELMTDKIERSARFRCVIAIVCQTELLIAHGSIAGMILDAPRGRGGFGYDPLFFLPEWGKTTAELAPEQKNRISHRGQALAEMARVLQDRGWTQ